MHPLSTAVNKPSHNDRSSIEPTELDQGLIGYRSAFTAVR